MILFHNWIGLLLLGAICLFAVFSESMRIAFYNKLREWVTTSTITARDVDFDYKPVSFNVIQCTTMYSVLHDQTTRLIKLSISKQVNKDLLLVVLADAALCASATIQIVRIKQMYTKTKRESGDSLIINKHTINMYS